MASHKNDPPIASTQPNLPVATEPQAATMVTSHNLCDRIKLCDVSKVAAVITGRSGWMGEIGGSFLCDAT